MKARDINISVYLHTKENMYSHRSWFSAVSGQSHVRDWHVPIPSCCEKLLTSMDADFQWLLTSMDVLPTARTTPLSAVSWGWTNRFVGEEASGIFPQGFGGSVWKNVSDEGYHTQRPKRQRAGACCFSLLSHWTWISLCYFILKAPLLSCGPHKVLLSLPYSHCLQDSRGFFRGWILSSLDKSRIYFPSAISSKSQTCVKERLKWVVHFRGLTWNLSTFLSLRMDDSLPRIKSLATKAVIAKKL